MISNLVTFANTVLTVSNIFLGAILHGLFRATNSLFKNNRQYEQFEAEIAKKLRTAQPEPKVTGSYFKKKRVLLQCRQSTRRGGAGCACISPGAKKIRLVGL